MRIISILTESNSAQTSQKIFAISEEGNYPYQQIVNDVRLFLQTPQAKIPTEPVTKEQQKEQIKQQIDKLLAQLYQLK